MKNPESLTPEFRTKAEFIAWELAVASGFFVKDKESRREVKTWQEYIPMGESVLKYIEHWEEVKRKNGKT